MVQNKYLIISFLLCTVHICVGQNITSKELEQDRWFSAFNLGQETDSIIVLSDALYYIEPSQQKCIHYKWRFNDNTLASIERDLPCGPPPVGTIKPLFMHYSLFSVDNTQYLFIKGKDYCWLYQVLGMEHDNEHNILKLKYKKATEIDWDLKKKW